MGYWSAQASFTYSTVRAMIHLHVRVAHWRSAFLTYSEGKRGVTRRTIDLRAEQTSVELPTWHPGPDISGKDSAKSDDRGEEGHRFCGVGFFHVQLWAIGDRVSRQISRFRRAVAAIWPRKIQDYEYQSESCYLARVRWNCETAGQWMRRGQVSSVTVMRM